MASPALSGVDAAAGDGEAARRKRLKNRSPSSHSNKLNRMDTRTRRAALFAGVRRIGEPVLGCTKRFHPERGGVRIMWTRVRFSGWKRLYIEPEPLLPWPDFNSFDECRQDAKKG